MSECQMCHCEDAIPSFVLGVCEDCYDEMKMESQAAGQDFYEYWQLDGGAGVIMVDGKPCYVEGDE